MCDAVPGLRGDGVFPRHVAIAVFVFVIVIRPIDAGVDAVVEGVVEDISFVAEDTWATPTTVGNRTWDGPPSRSAPQGALG
jgi:hypothetical protein